MDLKPGLLDVLERGGGVIAANTRAARDLRRLYAEGSVARGLKAWATPAIFDWHGFLAFEWQKLLLTGTEARLLLSPLQEEWLWQGIVQAEVQSRSLISPGEVARLAQRAYARLAEYDGLEWLGREWDVRGGEVQEPELFRRWAVEFERRCRRNGWLSQALLVRVLAGSYRSKEIAAPVAVAWVGFDRVTPAMAELREALVDAGCMQSETVADLQARQRVVVAQTLDEELEVCAEWVRGYLDEHTGARLGVLVHDVAAIRAQMDRTFRRVLIPGSAGLQVVEKTPLYEFTLGIPLGDVPMVKAALLLLRWMTRALEQDEIRWLMTTGFIVDAEEGVLLVEVDARLRRQPLLAPEEGMDSLLPRLEHLGASGWCVRLRRAKASVDALAEKKQSCRHWVTVVDSLLVTMGWPGARVQDSGDFQVRERWERVLEEVAALDFDADGARIGYDEFMEKLTGHARGSIFSAESMGAPVSISGVLESAGRVFDAVWMLGMTDEAWPARSAAHPMLPRWLQNELQIPRGNAAEDRALSVAAIDRLRRSARELVFSHAREGLTGALRGAGLLVGVQVEIEKADCLIFPPQHTQTICQGPRRLGVTKEVLTDEFLDESVVVWPEGRLVRGGHAVLKRQAACPFQAFAATRMVGRDEEDAEHALDAAQRGTLLHKVLQRVWADAAMGGSDGLHERTARGELEGLVRRHVVDEVKSLRALAGAWELAYLDLEEQRLCTLVMEWLRMELERNAFTVTDAEKEQEIAIGGLRMKVRIDRIDELEKGRVLFDYKTGEVQKKMWEGERPDEPQLPLYAVAGNVEGLQDLYFAQLRPDKVRFVGALTGDGKGLFNARTGGDLEAFAALKDGWERALNALSLDFQGGVAQVDPKDGSKTCKYCGLSGLCRVAEAQVLKAGDDEA